MRTLAVVGASGYVGGRLVTYLADRGHSVVALGRQIDRLPSAAERRHADVADTAATVRALAGVDTAYYLVHSMAVPGDFAARDRALAASFARAAAQANVRRVVYLGGLGHGDLSEHLRSRHEVGDTLRSTGVDVVELRAGVIIGAGSISFEMLRYLTERLPVMVCPRWITTRIQPIAEADLLGYLEQASRVPVGIYEIGGAEATTYRAMIASYAAVRGLHTRKIFDVPMLTPGLSARWVDLVTPVDRRISHSLIAGLTTEVVVKNPEAAATAFDINCVGVADAIRAALDDQAARVPPALMSFQTGLRDGVYAMRSHARLDAADAHGARDDLGRCGGDIRWYGLPWAWRLRIWAGRPFGERLKLRRAPEVAPGARVDWWRVEQKDTDTLVLGTMEWFCGEAWLGYRITDSNPPEVQQVGALRPKGLLGLVYWRTLWPVHLVVFHLMSRRRARRASLLRRKTAGMVPLKTRVRLRVLG
ncbi:MAG: DUF2867 domain-containing protein [Actinobacteria bacterium]|nr:DUF2867 domain-containing protein [Actinomycetota bacterium]